MGASLATFNSLGLDNGQVLMNLPCQLLNRVEGIKNSVECMICSEGSIDHRN